MKNLIYRVSLTAVCFTILHCQGQDGKTIFTQQQFFDIVLKYHPVALQADINIEKAKADILIARSGFDPLATMGIAQKTFDGTEYYNHTQPELRIPTWYGIELVAGAEYLDGDRTNREETLGQTSYAGVVIPLARNLLMDKRRAVLQTAKVFRNLSAAEKRSTLNNLLLDASKAYWDWAYQHQQLVVINNVVSVNKKRLELVKIAFRQGDKPALDTTESLAQLQGFQYMQNEVSLSLQNALLELSAYLWKEEQLPFMLPGDIIPENTWPGENLFDIQFPSMDDLLRQVRMAHPDLQQYAFKLEALTVERKLKFQELLPRLDFKYNQLGKGYNILNAKSGPLFNNNFQYGISFGMPLRLSQGRGEYLKAKLKINETTLSRDLKATQLEYKVKSYFNELVTLRNQASLLESTYRNFLALQKGEELKFFNGESSLFLVNSRENKTLEAMQKLLKTKIEFFKTYNSLQWAAGIIFENK